MQQQTPTVATAQSTPAAATTRDGKQAQGGPDAAQRTAQQSYLRSLRAGADREGQSAPPGAGAGPGAQVAAAPAKEGLWSKMGRKAKGAASWVGQKATDAKDAAVAGYEWTADKAGKAWDSTKRVASDTYDVLKNTSVGYKDGKVIGKTNVGEVMDLMPQNYRDAMEFDKAAKNEVSVEYDTQTGVVTARAASLALSKLALGPMNAGPTTLTDVVITLSKQASKGKAGTDKSPDDMRAAIHVGGVLATQVSYMGPKGLIKVEQVELSGLDASAFNPGGGMPMTDEAKDHLNGTFSLNRAALRGVSGDALGVKEATATGLKGGIDQDKGAAWAQLGSAEIKEGRAGQRSVKHAAVRDAGVGVRGRPGTAPLLEAMDQPLHVDTSLGGAEAEGLNTAHGSAKAASISGFRSQYNTGTKEGSASLDQARVQGGQVGQATVKDARVSGLHAQRKGTETRAAVEQATVAGLKTPDASVNAASVRNLSGRHDSATGNASAAVESARAQGVRAGKTQIKDAQVSNAHAQRVGTELSGGVDQASVTGLKTAQGSASAASVRNLSARHDSATGNGALSMDALKAQGVNAGGAKATSVGLSGLAATRKGDAVTADLASAEAKGFEMGELGGDLRARGAHASGRLGQSPTVNARVASLEGQNLRAGDARVQSAAVEGAHLTRDAKGGLSGGATSAQASGIRAGGHTVRSASASELSGGRDAAGVVTAGVRTAQAEGVSGETLNATRLGVDNVSARKVGEQSSMSADRVAAEGLAVGKDVKAETATGTGIQIGRDKNTTTAQVAALHSTGFQSKGLAAEQADVAGLDMGFGGRNGKARVDANRLDLERATIGSTTMKHGDAQGVGVNIAQNVNIRTHADALHADQIAGPNVSAVTLDSHGIATRHAGGSHEVKAADAEVSNLAVKAGGVSATLDQARAEKIRAQFGDDEPLRAGVGHLHGRGLGFESAESTATPATSTRATTTAPAQATSGPARTTTSTTPATASRDASGGVTPGQLVRGLSQRVDQVDARFSAPMRATDEGLVEVDPNTRLDAQVQARNNKLVPGQTGVSFSKPLDGPAWIGVRGVNLEPEGNARTATEGTLEADLSGFWDQDVTKHANKALGRDAKTLPLSVTELGGIAADKLDADAAARQRATTTPATPPAARGRGANARQTPPATTTAPKADASPLDMDRYSLDARVALSPGRVDLGQQQHVDIAAARPGGNEVNVRARGGEDLVVNMVQCVLGSMNLQVGQQKVKADGAVVTDAQVKVADAKKGGQFQGKIGTFDSSGVALE